MANRTHRAPQTVARKFDLTAILLTILGAINGILPGRGGKEKREASTPVLFNPYGRGINAYTLATGKLREFGDVPPEDIPGATKWHASKLEEFFKLLTEQGYRPVWVKDKEGKNNVAFRVSPVKGQTSGVDKTAETEKLLAKIFAKK